MPSPDLDQSDRRQPDQSRRPLSVATDNMMLEFYKKDGMGVRVMDTSWVSRRGSSSSSHKSSLTPPSFQPPSDSLSPEQTADVSASPSQTPPPISGDRTSTQKNKESSPVIGQRGIGQNQLSDLSPHTLHKVSKKLAPIPPKGPYSPLGCVSDLSPGPSPVSLSPTPPSTPSSYSFSYPQSGSVLTSPGHNHSQTLSGTLPKSRPKPPRQRPSLPPPQPPPLDALSAGESMSTDSCCDLDVPIIIVELNGRYRNSVDLLESEEESESTAL